jgi:DNA-binding beta-propeller fold protein YncE
MMIAKIATFISDLPAGGVWKCNGCTSGNVFRSIALLFIWAQPAPKASQSGLLLVANKGDNSLGIIDPLAGKQIAEIAEGGVTGHEIAASPDGKLAYVPIYGNSGVGQPGTDGTNMVVIDLAARKVTGNLDFGKGVRPHCAVFGPKNGLLYVSTELDRSISIIDPATLKIVGSVPTGQEQSHMFAITRDGHRAYTANVGPGTVSVLDLDARKTIISRFLRKFSAFRFRWTTNWFSLPM